MKNLNLIFSFCLIFCASLSNAQKGKYLVLFKDKNNSTHSISNPLTFVSQRSIDRRAAQGIPFTVNDLPPTQAYVDGVAATGATIWYTSRWANAVLVQMTPTQAIAVLALPYVKGFENNGPLDLDGSNNPQGRIGNKYDSAFLENISFGSSTVQNNMLGTQHLHNAAFKGEGKLIAVLDDGFNHINQDIYLASLFSENRIVDKYDFARNQQEVYDIGGHGNLVLSTMAANVLDTFVGTAPQAKYALFRTEVASSERLIEEANYLFACERADAIGADLINTSLGYSTFDNLNYNHANTDYNGDKTLVTRAADWAARAGILVCVSAGNSAPSQVFAPADADSVMAVGAVTSSEFKSSFSSIGPTADGRIKPDIAAMGSSTAVSYHNGTSTILTTSSGTSFSSPIFTGFAACFWQANPSLSNMQVIAAIKSIGTQANSPDNNLGWGIPKYPNLSIGIDQDYKTKTIQTSIQNTFLVDNQRFIAQVLPLSPNPISGSVFAKVIIDGSTKMVNSMPTLTRHFEITPAINPKTSKAKVTFFANQAEFTAFNTDNSGFLDLPIDNMDIAAKANLRILQYHQLLDNSFEYKVLDPVDTDIVWNGIENIWEIAVEVTGFSDFYITSASATVLPVTLTKFEVNKTINGNELEWETSNESNFSHFELEKSEDAIAFTKIGKIFSGEATKYKLLDISFPNKGWGAYYRLKMVDIDGKFSFSKTISIKNEIDFGVNILENPISNELIIEFDSKINGESEIQIFNLLGKNIFSKNINLNSNQLKINVIDWNSGEYILKFSNQFYNKALKFVKR